MSAVIQRAAEYAKAAHGSIDQRRKYTNQPYIVHPESVAEIVSSVTDDAEMICAAWLHDVVEDTPTTLKQIVADFGNPIANLVDDLTNVSKTSDGDRRKRAEINRAHTANASSRAKTIKLADIIDNLSGIARAQAGQVEPGFAKRFVSEKELLLTVLQQGDPSLYKRATKLVCECKTLLEI